ncbi:radical SAM protein [Candidatus Methanocrinis natronophilus]|uniref:Radical SAM protein n=1 Tax=Candidatus Methanocrinis natronophilus TaxID=3033396 RepID=A0ABT5XA33_9EURY|nr:radical SAM protein [Candidatus Methanocrinis natronophilus]MDF0591574.1 radical SAM protein [Candidatus Methanocrinis natronophilus]
MTDREWVSEFTGSFSTYLSPGCRICRQGASLVLFVTGVCDRGCFYCPLSTERQGIDAVYANERRVESDTDIIEEAHAIGALGTGITGGEPLLKMEFVIESIRALKREFGEDHHIHLYTGASPGPAALASLAEAGLDEIRFHPPTSEWSDPGRLYKTLIDAKALGLLAGVEIPALGPAPGIVDAVMRTDAFLNLNELEFSETNERDLQLLGFRADDFGSGAVGSELAAKKFKVEGLRVHYCSSAFKDAVQLRERLKRRAERTARPFDLPTDDGTIIFGIILPGEGTVGLGPAAETLAALGVPEEMYAPSQGRIEIAGWILEDIVRDLKPMGWELALEERYPLEGGPVVERIPL